MLHNRCPRVVQHSYISRTTIVQTTSKYQKRNPALVHQSSSTRPKRRPTKIQNKSKQHPTSPKRNPKVAQKSSKCRPTVVQSCPTIQTSRNSHPNVAQMLSNCCQTSYTRQPKVIQMMFTSSKYCPNSPTPLPKVVQRCPTTPHVYSSHVQTSFKCFRNLSNHTKCGNTTDNDRPNTSTPTQY